MMNTNPTEVAFRVLRVPVEANCGWYLGGFTVFCPLLWYNMHYRCILYYLLAIGGIVVWTPLMKKGEKR